jgi:hypothetical protein
MWAYSCAAGGAKLLMQRAVPTEGNQLPVRFVVLRAVSRNMVVFWVIALLMEAASAPETSVNI